METYIVIVVAIVIVAIFLKKGNNSLNSPMSTLVLTHFEYSEQEGRDELVRICGRQSGFIGWLLVKLKLGAETTLIVTKKELLIKSSSLSGEFHSNMSLKNISSSHCGFYKPIIYLILGIVLLIAALVAMSEVAVWAGVLVLIVAAIFFALYYFKKMIRIMVQTKGGGIFGMCFSPSFIEGINVNIEKAQEVVALINKYMLQEQVK